MPARLAPAVLAAALLVSGGAIAQPAAEVPAVAPAKPVFAMGGMNVYRRFPAELTAKMDARERCSISVPDIRRCYRSKTGPIEECGPGPGPPAQ